MKAVVATGFEFTQVDAAIDAVVERLRPLGAEQVALEDAAGRVLAGPIVTDRPSPACDVSAMDGYALRVADVSRGVLPVAVEVVMGRRAPILPPAAAARIFTGGAVPAGADAVVPREHVEELGGRIVLYSERSVAVGQFIRRQGENGGAGVHVVPAGGLVTSAVIAVAAAVGLKALPVVRRVRLSILVTGNEVREIGANVAPWQVRDSNGPALQAMFERPRWIALRTVRHAVDEVAVLREAIQQMLAESDAVLITGGVSMGDFDFVPEVLGDCGVDRIFHRLPIRPGRPIFAGIGPAGQAVVALPGNPVSAMVGARRIATPILHRLAGLTEPTAPGSATVANDDGKRLDLHWFRLVRLTSTGAAELIDTRGSGDVISAARSDGFIEVPRGEASAGPHAFYPWTIGAS